jgi:hypothetical protein
MAETAFGLEASFDSQGRRVAAYLRVRAGLVAQTREIRDGVVNADYDQDGALLGVELLGRSDLAALRELAGGEPEEVRRFLLGALELSPPE